MKKILLIQFRTDESAELERGSFSRIAGDDGSFVIDTLNATAKNKLWKLPKILLSPYDGIILGGSGEYHFTEHSLNEKSVTFTKMMENITPILKYIIAHDFPTLGVCFGHQMLANHLGTKIIENSTQAKSGSHEIFLCNKAKADPIFTDVPTSFVVQYGHKGSLSSLPKESILLANGAKCKYSAFKHKQNIYGVQFHPEMNKDDVIHKMRLYPEYKKNDPNFEQNTKPSPYAPYIIRNFVKNARKR